MLDYSKKSEEQIVSVGQAACFEAGDWQGMFLDCLTHLVEHLRLIIIVTLLAGLAAFTLTFAPPNIYASVAYLGPLDDTTAKSTAVLVASAPVLDGVVAKFPQYQPGFDLEQKREHLRSSLHWLIVKGSEPKQAMYTLRLDDTDPHRAQSLLNSVLDGWLESKRPRPDNATRLEKALEASEAQAADLSLVIAELKKRPAAMFADGRNGYFPPNIVDLIKMRTETAARIVELNMALRAGSRDFIFSPPSLPEQPDGSNRISIIAGVMAVTLGALIAFLLLRWSLGLVAEKPAYAPAFARMRRAMPW